MKFEHTSGSFTLPGESGQEKLTLELAEKWGADVIRDSDGTKLLTPGTTSTRPCASFVTTTNGRSSTPTACSRAFCPPTRSLPPKGR